MPSGAAALPARELTDQRRPDGTASRPTPAVDKPSAVQPYLTFCFTRASTTTRSRAVRQTSRKPREDCESDTTPASPFGGKATAIRGAALSAKPSMFGENGVADRMSFDDLRKREAKLRHEVVDEERGTAGRDEINVGRIVPAHEVWALIGSLPPHRSDGVVEADHEQVEVVGGAGDGADLLGRVVEHRLGVDLEPGPP
jgi:hypothetical protein